METLRKKRFEVLYMICPIDEYGVQQLKDVDRMNEGQNDIYYITGERTAAVWSNPFMETLRKNRFEVLYMIYPIDEYGIQQPREFDGKKLESVTKESLDIDDEEKKNGGA